MADYILPTDNPDVQDYQRRVLPGPMKILAGGALSLLAFSFLQRSSEKGLAYASRYMARNMGKVMEGLGMESLTSALPSARTALRGARAEARLMGRAIPGAGDLGIGPYLKEIPAVQRLREQFRSTFAKPIAARAAFLERAGLQGAEYEVALREGYHPKGTGEQWKAFRQYIKPDGGFASRFIASAGKWAQGYAKVVPGFYVADQALGLFQGRNKEENRPAWYNLPGHLWGMAKFGVSFAPVDIGFKGASRLFSFRKAVVGNALREVVRRHPKSREYFAQTVEKAYLFTDRWAGAISHQWSLRRGDSWTDYFRNIGARDGKLKKTFSFVGFIQDVIKESKVTKKPVFQVEQRLQQILSQVDSLDIATLRTMSKDPRVHRAYGEVLSKYERKPKETILQYVMQNAEGNNGWAPRKFSSTRFIKNFAESNNWTRQKTDMALKMLGKKQLYYGQNIFRAGNFSMFNASFAAEKVIDTIGKWKVPLISWRPFERMMLGGIPFLGIEGKFKTDMKIASFGETVAMAGAHAGMQNVTRFPNLKMGDHLIRIGDHAFQVHPKEGGIVNHWDVASDWITAREIRHLQGTMESHTMAAPKGWLGRIGRFLEVGQSSDFLLKRAKAWFTQDWDPQSPHMLLNKKGEYWKYILGHMDLRDSAQQKRFLDYTHVLDSFLYKMDRSAPEVLKKHNLYNSVLDMIGDARAKRVLNEPKIDLVIHSLGDTVDNAMPDYWNYRQLQQLRRIIGNVRYTSGAKLDSIMRSRASMVGQAGNTTVEEYLRGEYFRKAVGDFAMENTKDITKINNVFAGVYEKIDTVIKSKSERAKAKSLFTSLQIRKPLAKIFKEAGISDATTFDRVRSLLEPHKDLLSEIFSWDSTTIRDRIKVNVALRENYQTIESTGFATPINEIWRVTKPGESHGFADIFPGAKEDILNFGKKMLGMPTEGLSQGPEPYSTKSSMLFNRYVIQPFNMTMGWIGMDLHYNSNWEFLKKFAMKRALAIPAAIYGYRVLDAMVAANPILNNTIFDDGLTSAGAQVIGKANLMRANVMDTLGVTDLSRYMEGLMPGSVESPAAKMLRGLVPPFLGRAIGGGKGMLAGTAIAAITGFGMPDLTKSAQEIQDIYSGKEQVPVRQGRYWESSKISYLGGRISHFAPSWYTKIVSQYRYTDTALGTKLESLLYNGPLGALLSPYHNEKRHYYDRPSATTAGPFVNVPVLGPIMDSTLGRILKPQVLMHEDELQAAQMGMDLETQNRILPGYGNVSNIPLYQARPGYYAPRTSVKSMSLSQAYGESFYRMTEAAGLRGFITQSFLGESPGQYRPMYGDSAALTSFSHQFWDLSLGGGLMCFDEGTLISTSKGIKKISDIEIDNTVITLNGCKRVINKFERTSNNDDEMFEIYLNSHPSSIKVTGNHKVIAYKTKYHWKNNPRSHRPINDGICHTCNKPFEERLEEISVCNLQPGDFLITPISTDQNEYTIDLANYMKIFTKDYVYRENMNQQYAEAYEIFENDPSLKPKEIKLSYDAVQSARRILLENRKPKRWKRYIKLNEDLCYLLGWWIAEGWIEDDCQISFAMHENELIFAHKLGKIVEENFNIKYYIRPDKRHGITFNFSHRPFARFMKQTFGHGSHGKYISHEIKQLKNQYIEKLLEGYVLGDGWENESGGGFTTVSELLALDLIELFAKLKKLPSCNKSVVSSGFNKDYSIKYEFNYNKTTNGRFHNFIFNDKLYKKITKIKKIECSKLLYDLEIEDVHQYQANGVMVHNSEAFRRLYPRERGKNLVNPLRNLAPSWLPESFKTGDMHSKIAGGMFLLPGRARERMYQVRHDFPADIEYLGYDPGETAARMLKLTRPPIEELYHGDFIREVVQKQMLMNRQLLGENVPTFDPIARVQGTADAILAGSTGDSEVLQIKTTTAEQLNSMNGPMSAHASQVNFLLRQLQKRVGRITYIAADNPELSKTFYVEYSAERLQNDISRLNQGREIASGMLQNGIGQVGEAYSYADRLEVLANVAPYSDEYKHTVAQCAKMSRMGLLDQIDVDKINKAMRQRNSIMRKFDMYPFRFAKGKWLTPDTQYNLMSENTNIKAAAEYSLGERMIGAVWERASHFQFPLHNKLLPYFSPEELYERQLAGSSSGSWARPVQDYLKPWWGSFRLSQGPLEAAAKLGVAGAVAGGPMLGAAGVVGGLLYGIGRAIVGPGSWVPSDIRKERKTEQYFDALEYIKANKSFAATGNPEYLKQARSTIYGLDENSRPTEFYRAVPYAERPFFWAFAATTDPTQQARIAKRVSPTMKRILDFYWSGQKNFKQTDVEDFNPNFETPPMNWLGWRPDIPLEDIELRTVERAGMDCFISTQKILTLDGPVEIQNITENYRLINSEGELRFPNRIFKKQHNSNMLEITFKNTYFPMTVTETHHLELAKKCSRFKFREQPANNIRKYNRVKLYSYKFPETCNVLDGIEITEDLGFILGWFLAEGNYMYYKGKNDTYPKGIAITLAIHEMDVAEQLRSKIKEIFGTESSIRVRLSSLSGNPYIAFMSYNTKMAKFIYDLIYPIASTKKLLPKIFEFPLPVIRQIISQWINGDGNITNRIKESQNEIIGNTASEILAVQCWYILRSCGFFAAIQKVNNVGGFNPNSISYRVRIGKSVDRERFFTDWEYIPWTTLTVKSVKKIDYEGDIFDIEMPDNHFYTTMVGTVHNSHDFGMGWKPQQIRIHNSPYNLQPIDISSVGGKTYASEELTPVNVKSFLMSTLQRYGIENANVSVLTAPGNGARINLNIGN